MATTAVGLMLAATAGHAQTAADAAREAFRDDVHAAAGLQCLSCHQDGRPDEVPIARTAVGPLCAKCHSDAAYIRRFDPQLRVDQYAQYLTSTHGKRMAAGELRSATCADCHGSHGVRSVSDALSPVALANVAQTCATCHADPVRMGAFNRDSSTVSNWSQSVHAAALLTRGDASAPTCSTCHGSHGATPPGVEQVANVCGQCHVRESDLFRASPKKAIFDAIGEPECLACHGNHRIEAPSDAWVGLTEPAVCAGCHDESTGGAATIAAIQKGLAEAASALDAADTVLGRAERAGMLVDDGWASLRDAREHQIHSRVLVHAFSAKTFEDMASQGVAAARRARQNGEQALDELGVRRRGLGLAMLVILGFLGTLWVKIQRLRTSRGSTA